MSTRHSVLLSFAIVGLFIFLLVIVFGDKGLADLHLVRLERDRLLEKNESLLQENLARFTEKERLESDPRYIEHVARNDLGLVAADELIFMAPGSSSRNEARGLPAEP
jgi:cell division protein FtsB